MSGSGTSRDHHGGGRGSERYLEVPADPHPIFTIDIESRYSTRAVGFTVGEARRPAGAMLRAVPTQEASIEELLAQEFGSIPALVRLHAGARPGHPALIAGEDRLDYAGLDALMDRVAAALQRDG